MTHRRRTKISSAAELDLAIGASESYSIEDWLQTRCEFADAFDNDGGEESFLRVIFFVGNSMHAQYTIELPYPFDLADLENEADRAEHYFRAAIHASGLNTAEATLGTLDGENDVTGELASEILGGADPSELATALEGIWRLVDFDTRMDSDGDVIHAWFVPDSDRRVALGVGAVNLFVVPLHGTDSDDYWVDEWPEPAVDLWAGWRDGANHTDPNDCVRQLTAAIGACSDRRPDDA